MRVPNVGERIAALGLHLCSDFAAHRCGIRHGTLFFFCSQYLDLLLRRIAFDSEDGIGFSKETGQGIARCTCGFKSLVDVVM